MAWVRIRHSTERNRLLIAWAMHVRLAVNWHHRGTCVGLPKGSVFTCRNKELYQNSRLLQAYSTEIRLGFPQNIINTVKLYFQFWSVKLIVQPTLFCPLTWSVRRNVPSISKQSPVIFIGELETFYIVCSNCFKYITQQYQQCWCWSYTQLLDTRTTHCGNRLDNPACSNRWTTGFTLVKWHEFLYTSSAVICINPCARPSVSLECYSVQEPGFKAFVSSPQPARLTYTLAQTNGF